jgi:NIMA (never in mitosis gene a)-related kinase
MTGVGRVRAPSGAPSEVGGGRPSTLDDFEEISLIGEGAYSAVYKVSKKLGGKADGRDGRDGLDGRGGIYALKKVKLPNLTEKEKINALNEVRLLASVRHENVIAYKESLFDEASSCLCIITEYADGSDLFQKIVRHQKARQYIRESEIWHCVWGMSNGLKALHDF